MSDEISNKNETKKTRSSFVKYQKATNIKTDVSSQSNLISIRGCRISLQNNQLLTSIGIPSIDYFIGGGLPVGSVCIIGEDTFDFYSDIICRCFIAEGVLNKHSIYIANPFAHRNNLLQRIPNVNTKDTNEDINENENKDSKLRIAWRYADTKTNQMPNKSNEPSGTQNNYFYLNKFMPANDINECDLKLFQFDRNNQCCSLYKSLTHDLHEVIDNKFNITKLKQFSNILRIVINTVGSGFWNDNCYENGSSAELFKFLFSLRQLLRHSLGVCLITVQNELINDLNFLSKISNLSDYVFVIDNSQSTKSRLVKTQYEGLFRIAKLARLNSLNCYLPETLDLAFYIKRKRFVVEILALPPDILEDSDEKKGRTTTAAMACAASASGLPTKLDF